MKASVSFRFSKRLGDADTAHETGIFHYTSESAAGKRDDYIHLEALLVKQNGKWLTLMEYQKSKATKEEWTAWKSGIAKFRNHRLGCPPGFCRDVGGWARTDGFSIAQHSVASFSSPAATLFAVANRAILVVVILVFLFPTRGAKDERCTDRRGILLLGHGRCAK